MLPRNFEDRFWPKVAKTEPSECWLWGAALDRYGYGVIWGADRLVSAHRASWEIHNGSIGAGLCVLHRCDTPACVNPAHLFLGSQSDNMRDMRLKGRARRGPGTKLFGESNGSSKLTKEAVAEIRSLAGVMPQRAVAATYGISPAQVSRIQTGKRWPHDAT